MKNSIYRINFLLFILILSTFFCLKSVFAVSVVGNSDGGDSGYTTGCWTGNCHSLQNAGVRIALINSSGKRVGNVVDFYFYNGSYFAQNNGRKIRFINKNLKQDVNNMDDKDVIDKLYTGTPNGGDNFIKIEDVMPYITYNFVYSYSNGTYPSTATYYNNGRVPNVVDTIIDRIIDNSTVPEGSTLPKYPSNGKVKAYGYLESILTKLVEGYNSGNLSEYKDYYLQFEGISQWQNDVVAISNCINAYNFIGTSSEFTKLCSAADNYGIALEGTNQYPRCYIGNYNGVGPFNSGNRYYYYSLATVGIFAPNSDIIPKKMFNPANSNTNFEGMRDNPKKAYGVAYIRLDDIIDENNDCDSIIKFYNEASKQESKKAYFKQNVRKYLEDNGGSWKEEYNWLLNFDSYEKGGYRFNFNDLGVQLKNSCELECNSFANYYASQGFVGNGRNDFDSYFEEAMKKIGYTFDNKKSYKFQLYSKGLTDDKKALCREYDCDSMLSSTISNEEIFPKDMFQDNSEENNTGAYYLKDNVKLNDEQKNELNKLYGMFSNLSNLNPDVIEMTRKISCDRPKTCYPTPVSVSCTEEGRKFVLSDSEDMWNCLNAGTAYNNVDSYGNINGILYNASSYDNEYVTQYKKSFCYESVSFEFPTDVKNQIAGTLMVWGIDQKNHKYGKMNIIRNCYNVYTDVHNSSISYNWIKDINPEIKLYYKEAIPKNTSYSALKIDGEMLESTITSATIQKNMKGNAINLMDKDGNLTSYSIDICDKDDCSDVESVAFNLSYDLNYGNELKWYSHKGDGEVITSNDYSNIPKDKESYITIGYGLPTSFVTPTGLKGDYEYNESSKENDGYMYVTVKNIGTKSKKIDAYHFDNFLKFALTDDNDENNDSIYYKCTFDIINKLFGTEYVKDIDPSIPPKGLDVVFRTVQLINVKDCAPDDTGVCKGDATTINNDLNTAFPGRTGKGRYTNGKKIGSNWLTIDEDENKNTKRIFDILDNMIYAQPDPSYHIVLDTGKINYIREQNKKYRDGTIDTKHIKSDPYTDSRYFKFDKTNAPDYAYGASDFISDLIERGLDGACVSGDTDARAKRGPCRQT